MIGNSNFPKMKTAVPLSRFSHASTGHVSSSYSDVIADISI